MPNLGEVRGITPEGVLKPEEGTPAIFLPDANGEGHWVDIVGGLNQNED